MKIEIAEAASPVGTLTIAVHDSRLVGLCFEGLWPRRRNALEKHDSTCTFVRRADPGGVVSRLARYFDGDLDALTDIDVQSWGTPFQQSVWNQLRLIPAGQTRTYAEIARAIDAPTAVRAVGAANGANPIGIVVPCHRVIGSDGKLTGFAGGLPAKRWLLEHENTQLPISNAISNASSRAA